MKAFVLPVVLLAAGLQLVDEKASENEIIISAEGTQMKRVIRVDINPIVVHTKRQGVSFGDSKTLLTYDSGGRFLLTFLAESRTTRDVVVYQHEKAVVKLEDDFLEKLSTIANERDFVVIVLPLGVGKHDEDFDDALMSFLANEEHK